MSFFPQGGRDPLIVVICHSFRCHSQGKEGGGNLKDVRCHSFYRFFFLTSSLRVNLEVIRVNQGPVWGLLRYPEITQRIQVLLQLSMILNLCTSERHFVFQISQPPNIAKNWFCLLILRMDLSSQGKKQFVNPLHGLKVTTIS